jgi:hypothetical protein
MATGKVPAAHMVEKISAISISTLVKPNSSGVKNFGKRKSTFNAPIAKPA